MISGAGKGPMACNNCFVRKSYSIRWTPYFILHLKWVVIVWMSNLNELHFPLGPVVKCLFSVWYGHKVTLQWRHNGHDGVSNHQPHDCLLNRLFGRRSKKTSKLRVTGLCAGNSPVTREFPAQIASNAEIVSIWWRHHGLLPISVSMVNMLSFELRKQNNCHNSLPYTRNYVSYQVYVPSVIILP